MIPPSAGESTAHSPNSDLHELMAQVAAGLVAPETAAYQVVRQVGEDLGNAHTEQHSAADQLIHQLASPADVLRERQPGLENESVQDEALKVSRHRKCPLKYSLLSLVQSRSGKTRTCTAVLQEVSDCHIALSQRHFPSHYDCLVVKVLNSELCYPLWSVWRLLTAPYRIEGSSHVAGRS